MSKNAPHVASITQSELVRATPLQNATRARTLVVSEFWDFCGGRLTSDRITAIKSVAHSSLKNSPCPIPTSAGHLT